MSTWDAWLTQQWRSAVQRGLVPAQQLLSASQERAVWESVLAGIAAEQGDGVSLGQHASALMHAAARATQSELAANAAENPEEQLLSTALARVRRHCEAQGLLSLRLAPAAELGFLAGVGAPLIVGQPHLTALQERLRRLHWPEVPLLATLPPPAAAPRRLRASDLQQEFEACAAWCRDHLQQNQNARLLVLTACTDPSPGIQEELLWRALAPGRQGDDALRRRWLALEGGAPLLHQALIADALAALGLAEPDRELKTGELLQLLQSPYFDFGATAEAVALAGWLGRLGLASLPAAALPQVLRKAGETLPAAQRLGAFITRLREACEARPRASAMQWAMSFAGVLEAGGFAKAAPLDSRDLQRLLRWHELLDEFAGLDAVLPAAPLSEALRRLTGLAAQARHQAASGDAAVTLSDALGDPVAGYDGIWVLGMAESRWPASPRPEPWLPLLQQRHARWPESSVTQRREHAQWALQCWRARTADLVLSHPAHEKDLTHRPSTLLGGIDEWRDVDTAAAPPSITGAAAPASDAALAPVADVELALPLEGGAARLADQQECAFRAQARWRLKADPPARLSDGVPAWLRGRLLHALLNDLWGRLRDQAALLALAPAAEQQLLLAAWHQAVKGTRGAQWLTPTTLAREQARTLRLCGHLLELERQRTPFSVRDRERALGWQGAGARLDLRIDRVDALPADATQPEALLLIDYKSGSATRSELHKDDLRPLQLALYAAALAQAGESIGAAALLNLDPVQPHFSGIAQQAAALPDGLHAEHDWAGLQQRWHQALLGLMSQHLSGNATLTRDPTVCRRCHLPALCRRAADGDTESDAAETLDA